jgi:FkbM family methyltransferase
MKRRIDALRYAYWNVRHWQAGFFWRLFRTVSVADCIACLWLFPIRRPGRPTETTLTLRRGPKVTLRTYTTDPDVFRQVFVEAQYELPFPFGDVKRVVDAGANIGLSSLYFLLHYPDATVVALEPDPANYPLAVANTRVFGNRCRVLPAALWSHGSRLALVPGDAAWSTQVRDTPADGGSVEGLSLPQALDVMGWNDADIVKVDIEGAEVEVFSTETPDSVSRVRCWAIELHSDIARASFDRLFAHDRWRVVRRGEVDFACLVREP